MDKSFKLYFWVYLFIVTAFTKPLYALDITVGGNCTGIISSPLQREYKSDSDTTMINVINSTNSDTWGISVNVSYGVDWPNGVTLSIRATSKGEGAGNFYSYHSAYMPVTATSNTIFFESQGDRTAIPVQYKLSGISVSVPPGTYNATLTFTVVTM